METDNKEIKNTLRGKSGDKYAHSRLMYIAEETFFYFISMLVSGAYLARVTTAIGISDSLTGILSSFISLGCGFQIVAVFLSRMRPVKRWVSALYFINNIMFALVYLVPVFPLDKSAKTVIFVVLLLSGRIINNIAVAPKTNWFMALIDDNKRGSFTATKEITSLLSGMLFTFVMGSLMDWLFERGEDNAAFAVGAVTIFALAVLHLVALGTSSEKSALEGEIKPVGEMLSSIIKDKRIYKVILISVLWNVASYASTPFYGTYQIKELGFNMTLVSVLAALLSLTRAVFSRPLGKYADKFGFVKMLRICFFAAFLSFVIMAFTVKENGVVFYALHSTLYAIGMAGINSGSINLIYDYVDHDKRTAALAIKNTLAGLAGFFTTLFISPLVSCIQQNGNSVFGIKIYAQQAISVISAVVCLLLLVYIYVFFRNGSRVESGNS